MSMLRPFTAQDAPLRSRTHLIADVLVLAGMAVLFWLLVRVSQGINTPFSPSTAAASVSTDPANLPYYAARSLLRMFAALVVSVVFTFVYATAAARLRRTEKVLLPILDVLQSVPVLGFLSVTLSVWLTLFPHTTLGVECASVFAIFTSQAWNLTFAFYNSLVTQPRELDEAARVLRLTKWQRFWRLDVPNGMIPLVWNGMMSFGGGWFFLIASEVISVNNHTYALPGIGSYVAAAGSQEHLGRMFLAIGVMIVMVIGVNVLFWRPLTAWAEKFRVEESEASEAPRSLVLDVLRRSRVPQFAHLLVKPVGVALDRGTRPFGLAEYPLHVDQVRRRAGDVVFSVVVALAVAWGLYRMLVYVDHGTGLGAFGHAFALGLVTFGRVIVLVVFGSLVWVPIGVWIGMNPRVSRFAQPVVQVLASFPANFLFPLFTLLLIRTGISLNVGGIVLMSLGAQWYILFNVIAGASAIPNDLREASLNLRLPLVLRWRTVILPSVFGAWVTGALTAAGGAWNASIVAEVVSYGSTKLTATGLGAYIAQSTQSGDFAKTLVGVTVMSVYVVGLNRLLWRRLYRLAETRYSLT
ncbi:NitT/TauT family transport system permease protein [Kribbella aluminosa]|uniref:NitT/TauT family transport system permease protein n=1 Tax=Kribbella aluminosa TaxID=416017 RepID=A0ABS4UMU8_9ACTN|nr:ABC transporter permease subunit [Kribbella aluminosa]MBP2352939.1 NitT/TauT family transport system permease protein [Kribbella aluminosa]